MVLSQNLSNDLCEPYHPHQLRTFIMFGLIAPVIILLGLTSNCVNLWVFCGRKMRYSPINWYLTAITIGDICILTFSFCMLSFAPIADFTGNWRLIEASNYLSGWIYPFALITQTQTVWMTVMLAIHRCIGICFPFESRFLTHRLCKISIVSVNVFSVIYNISRFFEVNLLPCWSEHFKHKMVAIYQSKLRLNPDYQLLYVFWSYTVMMFIVPFGILILSSWATVNAVKKSNQNEQLRRFSGGNDQNPKDVGTTIMLVGVVLVFLLCNSFALFTNILEAIMTSYRLYDELSSIFSLLVDVNNFAVLINSTINILIYYLFSKKYREVLWTLLKAPQKPTIYRGLLLPLQTIVKPIKAESPLIESNRKFRRLYLQKRNTVEVSLSQTDTNEPCEIVSL